MKNILLGITSLFCASSLCFAQTPAPQFKLELQGDANDFILQGRSVTHTNDTADIYHDAEVDRLAFQIVPIRNSSGGTAPAQSNNWTLTVERNGQPLRQGQYREVFSQGENEGQLLVKIHPENRVCDATGKAEIRIIDLETVDGNTSLEKFKIDFELRCHGQEPKLRGSFAYNWSGDEPFKLDSSQLRASSRHTYNNYSYYEPNAIDGNLRSYWLTNANPQGNYLFNLLTVAQRSPTPYELSHMNVIFYSNYYAPNWFYYYGNTGTRGTGGWLPGNTFDRIGDHPAVTVDLGNLRVPRLTLGFWGNQYFHVIREVELYAKPNYSRWKNHANKCDVNGDGRQTPLDALQVINYTRRNGTNVTFSEDKELSASFYDLSGDGKFTALDLLQAQNCIRGISF